MLCRNWMWLATVTLMVVAVSSARADRTWPKSFTQGNWVGGQWDGGDPDFTQDAYIKGGPILINHGDVAEVGTILVGWGQAIDLGSAHIEQSGGSLTVFRNDGGPSLNADFFLGITDGGVHSIYELNGGTLDVEDELLITSRAKTVDRAQGAQASMIHSAGTATVNSMRIGLETQVGFGFDDFDNVIETVEPLGIYSVGQNATLNVATTLELGENSLIELRMGGSNADFDINVNGMLSLDGDLVVTNPPSSLGNGVLLATADSIEGSFASVSQGYSVEVRPGGTDGLFLVSGALDETSWNVDAFGGWNNSTNWTFDLRPNSALIAVLGDVINSPRTIITDESVYVRGVRFDNTNSYNVAGHGSVNLVANSSGPTMVEVVQGSHEFQARVNLHSDTSVVINSGTTLIFNNAVDLMGNSLTKTGTGEVAIRNDLFTSGGTVICEEGTCSGSGTISGNLNNIGGAVSPGNSLGVVARNFTQAVVPEPATWLLLMMGLLAWPFLRSNIRPL